jgi:hypothetical protein
MDPIVQAVLLASVTYVVKAVASYFAEKKEMDNESRRLRNQVRAKTMYTVNLHIYILGQFKAMLSSLN